MNRLQWQPGGHVTEQPQSGCQIMTHADSTNRSWHSSHITWQTFSALLHKSLRQPLLLNWVWHVSWVSLPSQAQRLDFSLEKDQWSWNSQSTSGQSTSQVPKANRCSQGEICLSLFSAFPRLIFIVVLSHLPYYNKTKDGFEILTGMPSNLYVDKPDGHLQ